MAGISLGGLSSGLDTQSIVDQLIAIDRAPETRMKLQQSALQARQDALTDIGTRLRNLRARSRTSARPRPGRTRQSLEVSDSSKLTATRLSGAAPGGHEINVTSLARAEQRSYAYTRERPTTLRSARRHIALSASDDGAAAADKINSNSDSPVYAVFVQDPLGDTTKDRLVLTRKDTGEYQHGATWPSPVPPGPRARPTRPASTPSSPSTAARSRRAGSNIVKSAVPGLQLTLKARARRR